ncbi:MAG: RpiB/LacA/LacB family sugar-phosphate isomerase [Verrucomicrobiota bacterium]
MIKLAVGSTKAGLCLKDEIKRYLVTTGHAVDDLGMQANGFFMPYYEVAARIAEAVSKQIYSKAVIICGTGAGSAIVANKFKGVYAVQASNEYEARHATIINNANVLTLGEWISPPQHAVSIVQAWLAAKFTEGFEPDWQAFLKNALKAVQDLEAHNLK